MAMAWLHLAIQLAAILFVVLRCGYCEMETTEEWENTETSWIHEPPNNGKVEVTVNLRKVEIDETALICNFTVDFNMSWTDKRLVKDDIIAVADHKFKHLPFNKIWHPKLYTLATPNWDHGEEFEWVFPDSAPVEVQLPQERSSNEGHVSIGSKKTLATSSKKEFHRFPGDVHNCILKVATGRHEDRLLFFEPDRKTIPESNVFSITINTEQVDNGAQSDKMVVLRLTLTRRMDTHLIKTHVPGFLFVVLSWVTIMLPEKKVAMSICSSLLLAVIAFFGTVREAGPETHYWRALDMWQLGVVVLVFLALLENMLIFGATTYMDEEDVGLGCTVRLPKSTARTIDKCFLCIIILCFVACEFMFLYYVGWI